MTVLDTAYRCPACHTARGNTPRDLPCPSCELTLDEAQEKTAKKPEPDWLTRQNALAPLIVEHDRLVRRLTRMQDRWSGRKAADSEDPVLDRMKLVIDHLREKKGSSWLQLIASGLKNGELPKLRALIAEGRLPRTL